MYIQASDLLKITINIYLRLEIWVIWGKVLIFQINIKNIYICTSKICEFAFKTDFSVNNDHLNLCGQDENSNWVLFSKKIGVNCVFFFLDF